MTVYYNEIDPYAAQWLRNLMAAGHIAEGEVDERSITEVQHEDLLDFDQCHFFAGIGVWSYALRRAGWADDRAVWTGSCPCQPFSAAGQQKGFNDERHLWPVWFRLIDQCRPPIVLGEQVANALGWLDLVSADMEKSGYAFGASDLCAAGFGGAHTRQRLYFTGVADTQSHRRRKEQQNTGRGAFGTRARETFGRSGVCRAGGLADTSSLRRKMAVFDHGGGIATHSVGKTGQSGMCHATHRGAAYAPLLERDAADWLYCRDEKWRPVEPSTFPLADAAPARVGRLRAYGNGLDAETAAQFIAAVMDCAPCS